MRGKETRRVGDAVARFALAVGFLVVGWRSAGGQLPLLTPLAYLAVVTGELWRIDRTEFRLPNALVVPGIGFAVVGVGWGALSGSDPSVAVAWGCGYAAVLLVPAVFGGAGMGDVKLAVALGLVLGSLGAPVALLGSASAFVAAGTVALVAVVWAGVRGGHELAFGPFMLGGFWGAVALAPVL
jgi:leader peptidase (prepilin peptidase)/N-methyltransferase